MNKALSFGFFLLVFWCLFSLLSPSSLRSHGGGLADDGCHYNRKINQRHCHRTPRSEGWEKLEETLILE